MINANELRIGNLIYIDNGEKPKYVYDISAHDIEEIEGCGTDAFAIPINAEWLLKFGFEYEETFLGYIIKGMTLIEHKEGWADFVEPTNFKPIKFVHQLQNLYFALTETELQFNGLA